MSKGQNVGFRCDSPRRPEREIALARIHAAGIDVLRERGPKRFSLEEVARKAGCSRATRYRFVGNKRALVDTLASLAATEVNTTVRERTQGMSGRELVVESIDRRGSSDPQRSHPGRVRQISAHLRRQLHQALGHGQRFARTLMDLGEEHDLHAQWTIPCRNQPDYLADG